MAIGTDDIRSASLAPKSQARFSYLDLSSDSDENQIVRDVM